VREAVILSVVLLENNPKNKIIFPGLHTAHVTYRLLR
jgi:hypothetical protein